MSWVAPTEPIGAAAGRNRAPVLGLESMVQPFPGELRISVTALPLEKLVTEVYPKIQTSG
jgi:hypothetical protein